MGRFVDSIIAYRILRMLTTPFEETEAFQRGIIDAKGKELKKMRDLHTVADRDAYSILHRMVFRIKRIIEKVPLDNKKLVSFAAALALIKEHADTKTELINLESLYLDRIKTDLTEEIYVIEEFINNKQTFTFRQFLEDIPANNAGTPGIAGFTPETMGVPKNKQPKIIKRKKLVDIGTNG